MPAPNRCGVCGEPTPRPIDACRRCMIDFDKRAAEHSVMDAILWAANRARWYAERRAAKNARAAAEREGRRRG